MAIDGPQQPKAKVGDKGANPEIQQKGGDQVAQASEKFLQQLNPTRDAKDGKDSKIESPLDKKIAQLEREVKDGMKAFEDQMTKMMNGNFKSLADAKFPDDHEFHPKNVMAAATREHQPGSHEDIAQKKIAAIVKGDAHPSSVLSS